MTDHLVRFTKDIETIPLPDRWKELIREKYIEDISDTDTLEELRYIHLKWHVVIKGSSKIYDCIHILDAIGAGTVKQLVYNHFFLQNKEPSRTEEETLEKALRRNLDILFLNCLVNAEKIPPVKGKRGTTLWFTHFVKDKRVKRARELYLIKGGDLWTSQTDPKSPEEVMDHNFKVSNLAKERKKKNIIKDTIEKTRQSEIKEAIKPDYFVRFKCTRCGATKKIHRANYQKYRKTGNKAELIGDLFGIFQHNLPTACLCGNNEWIRTTAVDGSDEREVITLDLAEVPRETTRFGADPVALSLDAFSIETRALESSKQWLLEGDEKDE